jgi:AcrR family transcriptional regulator
MTKGNLNKKKIIDIAIELISQKGIKGTSLADIAKNVGISKGTLYYYYSSKNDLIYDITESHMDLLTNRLFDIIRQNKGNVTWKEMFKKLFTTVIDSDTRTRLHIYLIQEILIGNDKLKDHFTATYNKWFELVSEAHQLITNEEKDISTEARIFVATIDGFIIQHIIGTGIIPIDDVIDKLSVIIGE